MKRQVPTGTERRPATGADEFRIAGGAAQNVIGLVGAALATLGAQILLTRSLGAAAFGAVTVVTQGAFVLSFATRGGMDMAVLRQVAIGVGSGSTAELRASAAFGARTGAIISVLAALIVLLCAVAGWFPGFLEEHGGGSLLVGAAAGLPALALAHIWLGATRGLKEMRHTLMILWLGQPLAWIALMAAASLLTLTSEVAVGAYSLSWWVAAGSAWLAWRSRTTGWAKGPLSPGTAAGLRRYAAPRAPAAFLAQTIFWVDLFVLTRYASQLEVGVYSAALRAAQMMVLLLTSVNLMFSPFIADLHARGELDRLEGLFKRLTRWTLALTLPGFLLLLVRPGDVLALFGGDFRAGRTALVILLIGQLVNVGTGSVGFILIMVGRTGWDLAVHATATGLAIVLSLLLIPPLGIEGAAAANAVTFGVSNILRLLLVKRSLGIQPYDRHLLGLAPAAGAGLLVMVLLAPFANGWIATLLLVGAGGTAAYAVVLLALLPSGEREALIGLVRHRRVG